MHRLGIIEQVSSICIFYSQVHEIQVGQLVACQNFAPSHTVICGNRHNFIVQFASQGILTLKFGNFLKEVMDVLRGKMLNK